MINKVTLIGNLGRDPEVRRLENGAAVARLALATNESYKDKSGEWQTVTEWHTVICWRNLAERAESQLKKGSLVYIEGKLTNRKWQDKDGNDRYNTEVVANTFRSMERRESTGTGGGFPSAAEEPAKTSFNAEPTKSNKPVEPAKSDAPAADDDLPF
ncbi:MAG: single-strand DNA-binding protein [Maribacter sp.]|jgi:single-strand DNA-binding protein